MAHIVESVLGEPAALSPEAARITASLHRPSLVPDVLIALRENGIEIEEISVQKPSLDEVFFTRTGRPEADETTGPDEPELGRQPMTTTITGAMPASSISTAAVRTNAKTSSAWPETIRQSFTHGLPRTAEDPPQTRSSCSTSCCSRSSSP